MEIHPKYLMKKAIDGMFIVLYIDRINCIKKTMCSYQKIRLTCIYLSSFMFTFMKCKKMLAGGTFDRKEECGREYGIFLFILYI